MKQLIFLLCLFVTIITVVTSWVDDASEGLARKFSLPKTDVKNCFTESNISLIDLNYLALRGIFSEDTKIKDSALSLGCLFACIFKKKEWMVDTHIDVEKLKSELGDSNNLIPEKQNQILNTCADQVKNLNVCEVIPNLMKCMILES